MVIKANTWSSKQKRMGIASASLNPVILTADQVTVKHLGAAHNQKRHGYRWGSAGGVSVARFSGMKPGERQAYIDSAKKRGTDKRLVDMLETYHGSWGKKRGNDARTGPAVGKPAGKKPAVSKPAKTMFGKRDLSKRVTENYREILPIQKKLIEAEGNLRFSNIANIKRPSKQNSQAVTNLKRDIAKYQAHIDQAYKKYGLDQYSTEDVYQARRRYMAATKEIKTSFTVFKDTAGDYRWVLQSSNAFRDRDGEIVSTKALEADVERSEKESPGNYGPLRWWHISDPLPLDIGACDWRVVHGRTLIESGTFKSEAIGAAIKEAAPDLQVSIGFNHPKDQPDPNGVFTTIRVFERSLLPTGKAANSFTRVFVKGDEMATKEEKLAALKLLGIDPQSILSQAEATEKELDAQSVAFKGEGESNKAKKKPMPMPDPEEDEEEDEDEEDEKDLDEEPVIGNMSVKEYAEMLTRALAPLAAHVQSGAKEATDAQVRAEKETQERAEMKEILSKQEQFLAAQVKAVEAQAHTVKELQSRLAELEGSAPRAVKGHRASEDPANVISEAELARMKEAGNLPASDPLVDSFIGGFLGITG